MSLYVAFLRGMNLGNRRLKNPELRSAFEALGLANVATFRASGNVVFKSEEEDEAALTEAIEAGLGDSLGYEVPVYLRGGVEVVAIAAQEPFEAREIAASKGKLQVTFLAKKPGAKARKVALAHATEEDRLAVIGRELYWLPSGGISESDLDVKAIEAALGPGTTRTMGTVAQIAANHCG
jgi:uncharacterized protein (DUF1697 family)